MANPLSGANSVNDGLSGNEIAYDARGNTIKLADMTLAYDAANRHIRTTYADGTVVNLTRDAMGRVVQQKVTPPAGTSAVTQYRFRSGGDAPWATVRDSQQFIHIGLPGGAQVSIADASQEWSYPGIQGHTIASGDGVSMGALQLFDPFGQPLDPTSHRSGASDSDDLNTVEGRSGWHQGAMKLAETTGSTTLTDMGARTYVAALGRFLQVDPIDGASANNYVWPADPIGAHDLSGERPIGACDYAGACRANGPSPSASEAAPRVVVGPNKDKVNVKIGLTPQGWKVSIPWRELRFDVNYKFHKSVMASYGSVIAQLPPVFHTKTIEQQWYCHAIGLPLQQGPNNETWDLEAGRAELHSWAVSAPFRVALSRHASDACNW